MKTYLTILTSLAFMAADVLFFVYVFTYQSDVRILACILLAALVMHAVLLYKVFSLDDAPKEISPKSDNFLFKEG